jgi:hypothetical protein
MTSTLNIFHFVRVTWNAVAYKPNWKQLSVSSIITGLREYKQAKRERACGPLAKMKITSLRSDLRIEPMHIIYRMSQQERRI